MTRYDKSVGIKTKVKSKIFACGEIFGVEFNDVVIDCSFAALGATNTIFTNIARRISVESGLDFVSDKMDARGDIFKALRPIVAVCVPVEFLERTDEWTSRVSTVCTLIRDNILKFIF